MFFSWWVISGDGPLLWGSHGAGGRTNINTKPPVNKAPGRVPATPEQVCDMPPCELPCSGLGRHYFRRAIQRPCLVPMQTTLETIHGTPWTAASAVRLRFCAASNLSVGNSPTARSYGRGSGPCQARSISAHPPLLLELQIEIQPREIPLWPRGSVSNMGVGDLHNPTTCGCWWYRGRYAIARAIGHMV